MLIVLTLNTVFLTFFSDSKESAWVQSLDRENPLEEEMVSHSRILALRIPQAEEPGGLWSAGSQRVGRD